MKVITEEKIRRMRKDYLEQMQRLLPTTEEAIGNKRLRVVDELAEMEEELE